MVDYSTIGKGPPFPGPRRCTRATNAATALTLACRAKAAIVLSVADLLSYRLKPGRLPLVARKPAAIYGDRNMLDMITADQHDEPLRLTRTSFDFAASELGVSATSASPGARRGHELAWFAQSADPRSSPSHGEASKRGSQARL